MDRESVDLVGFGPFRLDIGKRLLWHDGVTVKMPPKEIEILCRLVERSGELVTKDELMNAVWPEAFVEESNLSRHIYVLRKRLQDLGFKESVIENVPKRGYRFIGQIEEVAHDTGAADRRITSESDPAASSSVSTEELDLEPENVGEQGNLLIPDRSPQSESPLRIGRRSGVSSKSLRYVALGGILAAMFVGTGFLFLYDGSPTNERTIRSIAVLPFSTAADDSEAAYIGHGMTETLIQKLSRNRQIVVKRMSVPGTPQISLTDPTEIGRKLNVDALLEGGIQRTSDRVRIAARLVRVSDGQTIWNETYEEPLRDFFSLQDAISEQVFEALSIKLTGSELAALKKRGTQSVEAEQLYQRARFFWNKRTKDGFLRSMELYNEALAIDPSFPNPYAGIADAYLLLGDYGYLSPKDAMEPAKRSAIAALERDSSLAEAQTSLAYSQFLYDWEWSTAEASFKRAIELDPNYPTLRQWYAEYLIAMGRGSDARESIRAAQLLDPQSPSIVAVSCWINYVDRQYEQAILVCDTAMEMDSGLSAAYFWKGQALEKLGDYERAIEAYRKALTLSPESNEVLASLGHAFGKNGNLDEARQILNKLTVESRTSYVSAYFLALVNLGIGDPASALASLRAALNERSRAIPFLNVDPMLEELREEPEFQRLVEAAGLRQNDASSKR